jgi:hypothetical protein
MRSIALALGAALTLSACGGAAQPSPTPAPTTAPTVAATTAAPTPATKLTFSADLKTENEVPPIANDEKAASGKATVTFDLTRDASGKITAAKASIDATFTAFPATALITIGHIHNAAAGANGGVVVPWKTDADNPLTLTAGATTFKKADVTVAPDLAEKIIDKPSDFYVNFHSKLNPGGVVRGQLVKM